MKPAGERELPQTDRQPDDQEQQLRAALIERTASQTRSGYMGIAVVAALTTTALWNHVSNTLLIAWFVAFVVFQLCRIWMVTAFHRAAPTGAATRRWGAWMDVVNSLSALMWGLVPIFLFPADSPMRQFLMAFFGVGIACSALVVYAPSKGSYLPCIFLILLPIVGRHFYEGAFLNIITGSSILTLALLLVYLGNQMHVVARDTLKLRFEKNDLINSLLEEKARVERLNLDLKAEIIERERAEEALRTSEETARALLNATMDAALLVDVKGSVLSLNQEAARRFGGSLNELLGRSIFDLLPPEYGEERRLGAMEVVRTGDPERFVDELDGRHSDNTMYPVFDARGKVEKLAIFSRDITEQVKAELQLREAKDAAVAGSVAKSEFLTNMSHELRTPLNAVIGFSEVLEDRIFGRLNEKQMRYVGHVLTSGRHLLQLINDILDLAKIESGKTQLDIEPLGIQKMLEGSLIMIKERALKQSIDLDLRIAEEFEGAQIRADEVKFKQIMFNLLSNAAKFTPDGGEIKVGARKEDGNIIISVSDTGIGVKAEDRDRIFGTFEQVDTPHGRRQVGTGLGLALTRRLVELHGGRIWVESEGDGSGATFFMSIPLD